MKTTLGIDLGTQSVKVLFYDYARKKTIASASSPLNLYQDDCGSAEQQTHWWTKALRDALSQVPKDILSSTQAISVSGQQHGFVPIDQHGQSLAPVKLWCDTSTELECREITERLGGETATFEATGNKLVTGYTASKILSFKKRYSQFYSQLDTILLPHDYLNFWLTGERVMEMGDASGTGFLDVKNRKWSDQALQAIDPDRNLKDCLPTLVQNNQIIGRVTEFAAGKTGLPEGTPVAIGGGDNMMGAIGTGNIAQGKVTMSLGTSGTVYAYSDTPIVDPAGEIAAFCSSTGGWLPLLCTMNCTVTTELFRQLLDVSISQFDEVVSLAPAGSDGVITVPFFNGERTPDLPNAKGCVYGVSSQNCTREHLMRSGVEGATFALKSGVDKLSLLGLKPEEITLTGGGTRSQQWRQIVADVIGLPVFILKQDEGAAFGAALQALEVLDQGQGSSSSDFYSEYYDIDEERSCEPNAVSQATYKEAYEHYQEAVASVATVYK